MLPQLALSATEIQDISSSQYLLQVVLGLGLIVFLILALSWGLKWVGRLSGVQNQRHIKVVSQTALGVKEKLVIIEVGNKNILLGLTPNNISLLHTFADGEFNPQLEIPTKGVSSSTLANGMAQTSKTVTFQQIFQKFGGRGE